MANLAPVLRQRFFDSNGEPLVGGKLYSYIAGSATPLGTYKDNAGSISNTNPIILDSNGECDVYLGNGAYKFVLTDADDVTQWTVDEVSITSSTIQAGWTEHDVTDGQIASDLSGETVDLSTYSSAIYDVEIIRGTTVISNGKLYIQSLNGTGRVVLGSFYAAEPHGVTFSVSQAGTVVQLRAALDTGAGDGTIKMSRRLISA